MRPPRQAVPHTIPVGDRASDPSLAEALLAIPGVEEVLVVAEEGVAYLKVDKDRVDWARLDAFTAAG